MISFDRIRQRKIVQWALAYLAGAWLLLQVLDVLAETFRWPAAAERVATVLLAVGFLAVLILAWYHGEQGRQRVSGLELLMLAGVLALAGGAAWWTRSGAEDEDSPGSTGPEVSDRSIAVLPFASLSEDRADAYFADGIHDDILTHLQRVRDLKVISRTSVLGYRDGARNLRQIGRELGVATVLEGSLRRDRNRIRVTAQLIDARTDEHLWAENYDRELTDVFAIQSEVAQAIVAALRTHLTASEREQIERLPTSDTRAYDFYLQAREYLRRPGWMAANMFAAEALFKRALALDPEFATAHARLSHLHSQLYWYGHDRSPARLEQAWAALETARRLQPDLPEVYLAAGYYHYWGRSDAEAALAEFAGAESRLPGDSEVRRAIAFVQRRQGKDAEALRALESVAAIDPRNADLFLNLGVSYGRIRRFAEAAGAYEHALSVAPDFHLAALMKGGLYIRWKGVTDSLRAAVERLPPGFEPTTAVGPPPVRFHIAMLERKYDEALRVVGTLQDDVIRGQRSYRPRTMLAGLAHAGLGDTARARAYFDSARVLLETAVRERPEFPPIRDALAVVYAGLGRKSDALREARRAVELVPVSEDALAGAGYVLDLAAIQAQVGEADAAVRTLQRQLTEGTLTASQLRVEPRWDPLRRHPGFQRLVRP